MRLAHVNGDDISGVQGDLLDPHGGEAMGPQRPEKPLAGVEQDGDGEVHPCLDLHHFKRQVFVRTKTHERTYGDLKF